MTLKKVHLVVLFKTIKLYKFCIFLRPTYNYENNEVRRKDSSKPYDRIPDLPPPDTGFPNLFENLPTPYGTSGGFFGSFKTKDSDYSVTPGSYASKPIKGKFL